MPLPFTRYLVIFGLTAAAIIGLVWIYVATVPMAFMESGYPAWVAKSDMLDRCRLGQLAFFGDSRLEASVIPAGLQADARNLGLPAGTALETDIAVQRALRCGVVPKQVVLSLVPDHFARVSKFYWILTLRYGFLTAGELVGVERQAAALGDHTTFSAPTPDGTGGWARDWMYLLRFPSLSFGSLVTARVFGRYHGNLEHYAEVLQHQGWSAYHDAPPPQEPTLTAFAPTKLQNARFAATIRALQARGVEVLFLMTPYRQSHPESDAYLDAYRRYVADAATRFPGLKLLDERVPIWPDRLFADGEHLNPDGAQLFTQRLAACLVDGRLRPGCDLDWRDKRSAVLEMQ